MKQGFCLHLCVKIFSWKIENSLENAHLYLVKSRRKFGEKLSRRMNVKSEKIIVNLID